MVYIRNLHLVRSGTSKPQGKHQKPTSDTGDGLTGGYHLEIDGEDQFGFEGEERIRDLYDKPLSKKTFINKNILTRRLIRGSEKLY